MAEIELDPSLILSIVKDHQNGTCVFYVSLPPDASANNAQSQAAYKFKELYYFSNRIEAATHIKSDFAPQAMDALILPLSKPEYRTADWKILEGKIMDSIRDIQTCAETALLENKKFEYSDEIISCGLSDSNSSFTLNAKYETVSVEMLIPLR